MSVLLDEETVVLEGLDFDVPCEVRGHAKASVIVTCRTCKTHSLLCQRHYDRMRARVTMLESNPSFFIKCGFCQTWARRFDDLVEVTPL